jgi:hypothetical protein
MTPTRLLTMVRKTTSTTRTTKMHQLEMSFCAALDDALRHFIELLLRSPTRRPSDRLARAN